MSYSNDIKKEIIELMPKATCCRRSFLEGVLFSSAYHDGENIFIRLQSGDMHKIIFLLVKEIFAKELEKTCSENGGRGILYTFKSPAAIKFLSYFDLNSDIKFSEKCSSCRSNFLKGVFFSKGRVQAPENRFSLELSLGVRAESFLNLLIDEGLEFKKYNRIKETILYTKNSNVMENFFALCGMQEMMFSIINEKIKKDFKCNANRHRNIDTGNITRAVNAATEQVELIKILEERNLLASLPPELEACAKLRLQYPDKSLSQLAMISIPEITKSGLNHRMKKLISYAKELIKTKV